MIKPIKFEKGGKSEKATDIDIIKGIQNLLGVNDEEMEQLLQVGIKKYGSIDKIGEAIQESVSNLPQGYSYEDVANAVMQVFSPEESQMFKCGGKMQQLVSKHSKGNKVDCGCGGTKIKFGEDGFSDGMPKGTRRITAQKDTVETYPLGNIAEVTRKSYFGKPDVDYNVMYDNATRRVSTNPVLLNNIGIFARPFISAGFASDRITPEYQKQLESARNNTDFEVKEKQNGGIVKGQDGLEVKDSFTRGNALDTYNTLNSGSTRRDARIAYRQAKKDLRSQGLRGSELRQTARNRIMTPTNLPDLSNVDFGNLNESINLEEPKMNLISNLPEIKTMGVNYDGLSFGDAFNRARKSGATTFNWRGGSYNTNLKSADPAIKTDNRVRVDSEGLPIADIEPAVVVGDNLKGRYNYSNLDEFQTLWDNAYKHNNKEMLDSLYANLYRNVADYSRNSSTPFYNFTGTMSVPEKYSDINSLWKRSDANTYVKKMLEYLRTK